MATPKKRKAKSRAQLVRELIEQMKIELHETHEQIRENRDTFATVHQMTKQTQKDRDDAEKRAQEATERELLAENELQRLVSECRDLKQRLVSAQNAADRSAQKWAEQNLDLTRARAERDSFAREANDVPRLRDELQATRNLASALTELVKTREILLERTAAELALFKRNEARR